ncbi:MAG: DUF4276 family protein [Candidatus Poribacteria bacterium]|nr:DUF4276 family protein [Candidatus Poribacteria bacterium]
MTVKIGCVVEGKSEVAAVPILIRRVAAIHYPELETVIPRPIRIPRNQVFRIGELERAVGLAYQNIGRQGAIFIILDSDDDCPAELGPALLHRVSQVFRNMPIAVVLAKHEFEAWFLAAAESLRGQRGLRNDLNPPDNPEGIRGAKEWLSHQMESSRTYTETQDQPALAALFDIEQARRADSFDKCYRDIVSLLGELQDRTEV